MGQGEEFYYVMCCLWFNQTGKVILTSVRLGDNYIGFSTLKRCGFAITNTLPMKEAREGTFWRCRNFPKGRGLLAFSYLKFSSFGSDIRCFQILISRIPEVFPTYGYLLTKHSIQSPSTIIAGHIFVLHLIRHAFLNLLSFVVPFCVSFLVFQRSRSQNLHKIKGKI